MLGTNESHALNDQYLFADTACAQAALLVWHVLSADLCCKMHEMCDRVDLVARQTKPDIIGMYKQMNRKALS